ncbi:ferredoxin-dependent glutamate synthase [Desulfotomaculum nigrificans CO-1-SRB]|uniref:Ferredoxin-dependent glutamate synthase n=1 Tax=Desulfotomaculum nigrificans (strain DSM 14880 / VKM B-2319 / CO-1-SRB) TaxID=868595 RepID=F6B7N6_DESCC|nr:FMN-binding glutamate synthase family protein [Desulfotomaculum nigrificans]AEF93408.1 ferredoxin-dependent glutamate synthase [Desulfotomaculum nigrificans CO-1-SRB]
MTFSKGTNASTATLTKLRTPESYCPFSGMCTTCLDGCPGFCEIGKSAVRGKEVLYPQPFGKITSASQKDYPVDYSHFNIMGTAVGAHGIEADPDKAIFPAVNLETFLGANKDLKLNIPIVVAAMGSTNVSAENWDHLAAGCAISGAGIAIGENVCAMDPNVEIKNGRVVHSPNLSRRVKDFQEWSEGAGFIAVQANVEDTKLGVQEYAIEKLGVEAVEIKWGQGAKDIGGEVKLNSLERALQLKSRGYIVLPNPEDPKVQEAYKMGAFKEFERHSRIGMVSEESFVKRVEELRAAGAKYVFLKTGAYRPADLARAVKFASLAKIDLLTVDGAGGGTGMSPWRMMNEWGVPSVYLHSLLTQYCDKLAAKGEYVPPIALAGGFTLEDHLFKGLAIGAPYVKAIGIARSALTAAMVGKNVGEMVKSGKVPAEYKKYGETLEQIFINTATLKDKLGDRFDALPVGAIGVYTYFERLSQGLRQFMCGARKFALEYIDRNDLVALTREAAEVSGIKYVMDADADEVEKILG